MAKGKQCKWGRLKHPMRDHGKIRYCKIAPKTMKGKKLDKKRESNEIHEVKYRKYRDVKRTSRDIRKLANVNI